MSTLSTRTKKYFFYGTSIYSKSIYLLFFLFFLSSLFFPTLEIKKLLFLLLFSISLPIIAIKPSKFCSAFSLLIIFLLYLGYGILNDSETSLAYQFVFSLLILFLYPLSSSFRIDLEKIVITTCLIFSIFIIFFTLAYVVSPSSTITLLITDFFSENKLGYLGKRSFGSLQLYMIHFRTSPFLIIPFLLLFRNFMIGKNSFDLLKSLVILLAILFSASRGLILFSIIGLSFIIILYLENYLYKLIFFFLVFILSIITIYLSLVFTTFFNLNETSNFVKINHFYSFVENLDLKTIFFGNGLASTYYSSGVQKVVAQTEITFIDMIRYFGLPMSVLIYIHFYSPNLLHYRILNYRTFIITLYIINANTNPLLLNSTGMLAILWYWSSNYNDV